MVLCVQDLHIGLVLTVLIELHFLYSLFTINMWGGVQIHATEHVWCDQPLNAELQVTNPLMLNSRQAVKYTVNMRM